MVSNIGGAGHIQPSHSAEEIRSPPQQGTSNLRKAAMEGKVGALPSSMREAKVGSRGGSEARKGRELAEKATRKTTAFVALVYTNLEGTNASSQHFHAVGAVTIANLKAAFEEDKA